MSTVTHLYVNGSRHELQLDLDRSLLSVLRDDLGLTGTKYGCGEGQCGACMVLIDGEPHPSCQTPVKDAAGKLITTIEGLERDGDLHPVQKAFLEVEAMQCGYCTPGMIISAVGLLLKSPDPDEGEIIRSMDRNICRCGTYGRVIRAIRQAGAELRQSARPGARP